MLIFPDRPNLRAKNQHRGVIGQALGLKLSHVYLETVFFGYLVCRAINGSSRRGWLPGEHFVVDRKTEEWQISRLRLKRIDSTCEMITALYSLQPNLCASSAVSCRR